MIKALNDNVLDSIIALLNQITDNKKQLDCLVYLSAPLIISLQSEKQAIKSNDFLDTMIKIHGLDKIRSEFEVKLMNSNQIYMIF